MAATGRRISRRTALIGAALALATGACGRPGATPRHPAAGPAQPAPTTAGVRLAAVAEARLLAEALATAMRAVRPELALTLLPPLELGVPHLSLLNDAADLVLAFGGANAARAGNRPPPPPGAPPGRPPEQADSPPPPAPPSDAIAVHPLGRAAIAFACHRTTGADALSRAQVSAIYRGAITRWEQVGAADGRIIPLDRPDPDPMRRLLGLPPASVPGGGHTRGGATLVLPRPHEVVRALALTPHALGYGPLTLFRELLPDHARLVAVEGALPDWASVQAGRYPWTMPLSLLTRRAPAPAVAAVLATLSGAEFRAVLETFDVAPVST